MHTILKNFDALNIRRVYIDTSVVGGFFDPEFQEDTRQFFKMLEDGEMVFVVSDLMELELLEAPSIVGELLSRYSKHCFTAVVGLSPHERRFIKIPKVLAGVTNNLHSHFTRILRQNLFNIIQRYNFSGMYAVEMYVVGKGKLLVSPAGEFQKTFSCFVAG